MTFLPDVVKQMFDHMSVHSWIQESVEGFVYSEIRQHVLKNTEMISPSPRLVSLTLTTAVCVELPDRWTDGGTPRANVGDAVKYVPPWQGPHICICPLWLDQSVCGELQTLLTAQKQDEGCLRRSHLPAAAERGADTSCLGPHWSHRWRGAAD